MNKEIIDSWENCLLNLCPETECINYGSFIWHFPISSFDLINSEYIYGSIFSFKESIECFEGVVPSEDYIVIGAGISGEMLIMRISGVNMYNCYWLGVGFEYHDFKTFNDLLGPSVGHPSSIINDILHSHGLYIFECHDRFS